MMDEPKEGDMVTLIDKVFGTVNGYMAKHPNVTSEDVWIALTRARSAFDQPKDELDKP